MSTKGWDMYTLANAGHYHITRYLICYFISYVLRRKLTLKSQTSFIILLLSVIIKRIKKGRDDNEIVDVRTSNKRSVKQNVTVWSICKRAFAVWTSKKASLHDLPYDSCLLLALIVLFPFSFSYYIGSLLLI